MATAHTVPKRAPVRPKQERLPRWVVAVMAGLFAILLYGLVAPKSPNAFDRPEAQVNQPGPPWISPHSF